MRVAVVAPRYTEVGGMQSYARAVVAMLRDSDVFEVVVVTTRRGVRTTREHVDGVEIVRLGSWLTLSNTPVGPLWWWQLRRLFARLHVDLVNAHSPVPYLADMAVLAAGGRPAVLTYHAGSLRKESGGAGRVVDAVLRAYERWVLPQIFRRSTRLIAVSPVAMSHRVAAAPIITPGVDTTRFTPPPPEARRSHSIVYVGRVERTSRWKGLHVLVDALPAIRAAVPDAVIEVVGDGDDVAALTRRAHALGVGDAIHWRGAIGHDVLPLVLQRAGVTVLPSLTEAESFGMALVEAMACGCPVVGSAVGGIPYVINDGVDGLLVPPGDRAALADAVVAVLTDPVRTAALGSAGRQAAESIWDLAHQRERSLAEFAAAGMQ